MIHAGQFAILKSRIDLPGYQSMALEDDWILSWHSRLSVWQSRDRRFLLLGMVWQTDPERKTPAEEIERLCAAHPDCVTHEQIMDMEETWCGRYVLIYQHTVFMDAMGLLSVFYSPAGISSDCGLLARGMQLEETAYQPRKGALLNWMPGPWTHYEQISRLLPSQILDYQSGEITGRQLLCADHQPCVSKEQTIEVFIKYFTASLKNLRSLTPDKNILVALTGGVDSRTLFALAKKAGLDFEAFTLEHDNISIGDIEIPRQICERAHTKHEYWKRKQEQFSQKMADEYKAHTAGLVQDTDVSFYAYGQFSDLLAAHPNAMILRGGLWEIATGLFKSALPGDGIDEVFYTWFDVPADSREHQALEAYACWRSQYKEKNMSFCDVFYADQRAGCWLAPIEAGFDLLDGAISVQPLNCRKLITYLFDFPREERLIKEHQVNIIRTAYPEIADIPFGGYQTPNESRIQTLIKKIGRGFHRLRTLGIRNTWKTYSSIFKNKRLDKELHQKAGR